MCAAQASFKTVFKNWPPVKLLHQTNTGQKTAANGRCLSLLAQVAMQLVVWTGSLGSGSGLGFTLLTQDQDGRWFAC